LSGSLKFKSLTSLIGQVIQFVVGLIITPFVISNLGEEYFSLWIFFYTFISFEGLFLFGTIQSVNRYVPFYLGKDDNESLVSFVRSHLYFYSFVILLIWLSVYFLKDVAFNFFELPMDIYIDYSRSIPIIITALSLSIFNKLLIGVNNGHENYVYYNISLSASIILRLVIILLFIDKGFLVLPWALLCSNLFLFILLVFSKSLQTKNYLKGWSIQKDFDFLKISLVYGGGGMLMYASDALRNQLDTFLILKFINLKSIAYYKIGTTLIFSVNALCFGLFGVLLTRLSFHKGAGKDEVFKGLSFKSFFYSSVLASYFILGISLMAPDFLKLWIGDYNQVSLNIVYLMLIPQLLMITQYPGVNIMYSLNKHNILGISTFFEAILNFTISIILVQKIGVLGVVIGTATGFMISKGLLIPLMLKKYANLGIFKQLSVLVPNYCIGVLSYGLIYLVFSNFSFEVTLPIFVLKCFFITFVYFILFNIYYTFFPKPEANFFKISEMVKYINAKI